MSVPCIYLLLGLGRKTSDANTTSSSLEDKKPLALCDKRFFFYSEIVFALKKQKAKTNKTTKKPHPKPNQPPTPKHPSQQFLKYLLFWFGF